MSDVNLIHGDCLTEKQFTMEEMYTYTNKLLWNYAKLFKNQRISFAEFTLIKSIIMEIQAKFEENELGE